MTARAQVDSAATSPMDVGEPVSVAADWGDRAAQLRVVRTLDVLRQVQALLRSVRQRLLATRSA